MTLPNPHIKVGQCSNYREDGEIVQMNDSLAISTVIRFGPCGAAWDMTGSRSERRLMKRKIDAVIRSKDRSSLKSERRGDVWIVSLA